MSLYCYIRVLIGAWNKERGIRQHTSTHVSIRQYTSALKMRPATQSLALNFFVSAMLLPGGVCVCVCVCVCVYACISVSLIYDIFIFSGVSGFFLRASAFHLAPLQSVGRGDRRCPLHLPLRTHTCVCKHTHTHTHTPPLGLDTRRKHACDIRRRPGLPCKMSAGGGGGGPTLALGEAAAYICRFLGDVPAVLSDMSAGLGAVSTVASTAAGAVCVCVCVCV